jgi:hypothetical protein
MLIRSSIYFLVHCFCSSHCVCIASSPLPIIRSWLGGSPYQGWSLMESHLVSHLIRSVVARQGNGMERATCQLLMGISAGAMLLTEYCLDEDEALFKSFGFVHILLGAFRFIYVCIY